MARIGLFFGTQTGNTQTIAEDIQEALGGESVVTLHDVSKAETSDFEGYETLIIGCPTWNTGEMQSDWEDLYDKLDEVNFNGKTVAYFAPGDQVGYAYNFQDAMGILEEKISSLGGKTVGRWSVDGYNFTESKAVKNGKFVGLALDEDNQSDLTDQRIKAWTTQLKQELGI